jgi:hypothetical protein
VRRDFPKALVFGKPAPDAGNLFFCLVLLTVLPLALGAQQKYAVVIGNGAYTLVTKLNNPVNDANDMNTVLIGLGFQVDLVINGSRRQMERAVERLKNRLSLDRNSYGFLFYAGHGVQSNGENFLIPIDADIRSESYLRDRAVSVQAMLDELNNAENELNIVILDACRDNPFGWSRSGSRGLALMGNQPADSIIVYATSAGSVASDGSGRNGLFTGHLLNNLKIPGLEVTEIFRRTMSDVIQASRNQQRPAVYNQFPGIAYLSGLPESSGPAVRQTDMKETAPTQTPVPAAPVPQRLPGDDFELRNGVLVTYKGSGGVVVIPENMGITAIGEQAFAVNSSIISVAVPPGVTSIGDKAFYFCSSLNSVTLPPSLKSIENNAFANCSSLNSIGIPQGLVRIGDNAFQGCRSLSSIDIPGSITVIGDWAFNGCASLRSVVIPPGTAVGNNAFQGCSGMTTITISEGISSIGPWVFSDCRSLQTMVIPPGVVSIGEAAFARCEGLKSLTVPDSIASIGDYAFSGCVNLTTITGVPGRVKVGTGAFQEVPGWKRLRGR